MHCQIPEYFPEANYMTEKGQERRPCINMMRNSVSHMVQVNQKPKILLVWTETVSPCKNELLRYAVSHLDFSQLSTSLRTPPHRLFFKFDPFLLTRWVDFNYQIISLNV